MRILNLIFLLLTFSLKSYQFDLEGTWQLVHVTGFDTFLERPESLNLTEEQKINALVGLNYVLENTKYTFKGDSVFLANAGPNFTVHDWKGKFLLNEDTVSIFYQNKIGPTKLFISSLDHKKLKLKFVRERGLLGPTEMTFERLE